MADGFVPPQAVRNNAKRGLELRKKHGRGGTEVGVARARDLSNGAALSLDTIKRMNSYFARHEVDKKGEGWGVDSAGYIAWLLWGGDAGRSWARGITNKEEAKEKSTVKDLTTAYFEIIKSDKRDDGTLMVYGKATDDSLDIDQQICDPLWLDRAMPEWFKSGGNIREQHSSIAAGVAKEYEKKADGHYIHALVVDPISVKKVDNGVLKGFSIGIKSPRVVRDQKAANGRIIDGQIVEVSLVDRPANPNCQLVLAKSVEGESGMWKTEELIEKEQTREANGRFGPSTSSDSEESGNYQPDSTDQVELRGVIDDNDDSIMLINDMADEESDDYEELSDDDEDAVDNAIDSIKEGNAALEEAYYAKTEAARANALDNAMVRYDEAHSALRGADSRTLQGIADDIDSRISTIETQYDAIMDKSVTGDLNKEQPREANGRFGSSNSSDSDSSGGADDDSMEAQEERGRDDRVADAVGEDLVDLTNDMDDTLDDMEEEEEQELYADEAVRIANAQSEVARAQGYIDDATRPDSFDDHVSNMEKAKARLEIAASNLARGESSQNFVAQIQSSINDINNYLGELDKSVTGDLNKEASLALQLSQITDLAEKRAILMKNAQELIELSKSIVPADIVKFDQKLYDDARRALAQLIVVEANEMDAGSNEEMSIAHLLTAVHHLLEWYEGEVAEGEVMDQVTEDIEMAAKPEEEAEGKPKEKAKKKEMKPAKDESKLDFMKRCKEAGMKRMEAKSIYDKYMAEEADMEKSAAHKCLECGCGVPQDSHGRADVSTAQIITPDKTPKSAEPTEEVKELKDQELPVEEDKVSEGSDLSEEIEAIVEKAIKSATESLKSEIAELTTANKAAVEKAVGLESELAVTKSLAVAGGPKRTIKPVDHSTNDLLVKAATYKAKADATTDPDLMKGYKLLAEKYFAEADVLNKSI
jgi:hypothetical protein